MQFRLTYEGPLPSNGKLAAKHAIRRQLHPQLKELWTHQPLRSHQKLLDEGHHDQGSPIVTHPGGNVIERRGAFAFAPLICGTLSLLAELEITLLRPTKPGPLIKQGGDLDNQLKTLFDALRVPEVGELSPGESPQPGEDPFHCLLDDDERIRTLAVEVDRYLAPPHPKNVRAIILVRTRADRPTCCARG